MIQYNSKGLLRLSKYNKEGSKGVEIRLIKGIHGLFYSSKPEETRAFIRDKLQLPFTDTGEGWLIFDFKDGDLGVHPTGNDESLSGFHEISFYTENLEETVKELQGRGVEFNEEIKDEGFGYTIHLFIPGDIKVLLYQPKYTKGKK